MKTAIVLSLLLLLIIPVVLADLNFNEAMSPEDKANADQILSPLMKIYNFAKYAATMVGVLMFVFAGISFVTAGGDMAKKERAKQMAVGVVIGLVLIWVAPLIVGYITG